MSCYYFAERRGRRGTDSRQPSDEEYDTADNASVISSQSDTVSVAAEGGGDEVDELANQEEFEDQLKDCIDGITQKRYVCTYTNKLKIYENNHSFWASQIL